MINIRFYLQCCDKHFHRTTGTGQCSQLLNRQIIRASLILEVCSFVNIFPNNQENDHVMAQ